VAGWVVVWTQPGGRVDAARWQRTLTAARRGATQVEESVTLDVAIAAWRRPQGEFPQSGRILRSGADCAVAWLGQCLSDDGDETGAAVQLLAGTVPALDKVAELNGPFAAAVVQRTPRTVTVWTDRYRHYPVYVHRRDGMAVASTDLRVLRPWLAAPQLDLAAIDLMIRCGELIDRMTLLRDVEVLPGGLCLQETGRETRERIYWRFEFRADHTLDLETCAAVAAERLTAAVRRINAVTPQLGVPLSGGLDSRLILGLCMDPRRVPSFTWGTPGCRDLTFAAEFAAQVASPHEGRFWDPPGFIPLWSDGVARTGGATGVHEMYTLAFLPVLARHCEAILDGLAGDAMLGGSFLKRSWLAERDPAALAQTSWRWRVTPEQDAWADRLLGGRRLPTAACERWCDSIVCGPAQRPVERLNAWLFENRVFRHANCGTMLLRAGVESHAPFFDRNVVDLLLRVPLEYKLRHRLYLAVLKRACPAATRVRWQRTGLPPAWGYWPNLAARAWQRGLRMSLKPLRFEPFPRQAVACPDRWFRQEWRAAAEQVVLGERALERGLFDPVALRDLWHAHQNGADFTQQLGVLVAIELFARLMLDGDEEPALSKQQHARSALQPA